MTEQELRDIVLGVVARKLAERSRRVDDDRRSIPGIVDHPSHDIYVTVINTGDACVIEPGVTCNHCNYCKSHGH